MFNKLIETPFAQWSENMLSAFRGSLLMHDWCIEASFDKHTGNFVVIEFAGNSDGTNARHEFASLEQLRNFAGY